MHIEQTSTSNFNALLYMPVRKVARTLPFIQSKGERASVLATYEYIMVHYRSEVSGIKLDRSILVHVPMCIQGDHSACDVPPVDLKTKVPPWPG